MIVIDNSRSMRTIYSGSNSILSAAQNAIIDVINRLNQNDRIAVLPLIQGTLNEQLTECYDSLLAFVTPASKPRLKTLVYSMSIDYNNADYEKALRKAFSYFNISGIVNHVENRDRIILFLSHGESSTGRNPAEVVKEVNAILGNSASLIIYGIGSERLL